MERTEFLELATATAEGSPRARARFIALALAAGFVGGRGGWVRFGETRNVCQGWAALAKRASQSGWVLERFVDAGTVTRATVVQAELDRSEPATFPPVESVAPDAGTVSSLAAGTEEGRPMEDPHIIFPTEAPADADKDLGAGPYAIEVLTPVSGVARVAVLAGEDKRVQVFHGDTALQDAVSAMIQYNAGTATPPEPVEPKVHPGDVVTIHRGLRRYEVLRVELDAFMNGERCDHARVAPCDPGDVRDAQWVSMDLLHVVEPVATLNVVEVNGFMVTEELVDLGHHVATETEAKRVALIPDPAMGGAKTRLVLVDPRFPRGAMLGAEETAERPVMYPGDSVILHRPSGNTVARWMPELDPTEASNVLQDVTWVSRTHATS